MADTPLDDADQDPPEDRYEPTELEATLARQQGLGVGARDLARQRDVERPAAAEDEPEDEESAIGRSEVPE